MPKFAPSVPLVSGFSPDPSICRAGDDYYLVLSSFDYFPGVPLYHSRDARSWRQVRHVLDRPAQLPLRGAESCGGIFAPTLRFHDGWFYMVTTNTTHGGNFFVKTRDPAGPWSDPVWLDDVKGIDPDLFWDIDGTAYLHWSIAGVPGVKTGIRQAKIDLNHGRLLEEPRLIWDGTGGTYPEGPHLFRRGAWYYLCIAEGGTDWGHMQTVARSAGVQGPWEPCPRNPVMTHRSLENQVQCVGHADLVETPGGEWFGVCHGVRHLNYPSYHLLGREVHLFPVRWDADGWPVFARDGVLTREAEVLPGVRYEPVGTLFEDEFNSDVFPPEWLWLRNPVMANYQRTGGALVLRGTGDAITSTDGAPTWIGVRQRDHAFRLEAEVTGVRLTDGAEAGLVIYQSNRYHAMVGVRREGGADRLFVRQRLGRVMQESSGPASGPRSLVIQADRSLYRLGWRDDRGEMNVLGEAEAKMYSVEVGGKFTGVTLGMYVQGQGELRCGKFVRRTEGDEAV